MWTTVRCPPVATGPLAQGSHCPLCASIVLALVFDGLQLGPSKNPDTICTIGLFSFGKKNGTEALSQRKSTVEQLPCQASLPVPTGKESAKGSACEAHGGAGLCRLAQGLRVRASTDPMSSTGGAQGASDRPKRARAGQRAPRLDEYAGASARGGVREGTQPKKSRSRDDGQGAAVVSTDYVARSEPLSSSFCV